MDAVDDIICHSNAYHGFLQLVLISDAGRLIEEAVGVKVCIILTKENKVKETTECTSAVDDVIYRFFFS